MTNQTPPVTLELAPSAPSLKALSAVCYLVITTACFFKASAMYDHHLVTTSQFSLLRTVNEYVEITDCTFYALQLVTVLLFFRPFKLKFAHRVGAGLPSRTLLKDIAIGSLAGITAFLVAMPTLLGQYQSPGLASLLANHFYDVSGWALLVLLLLLLPTLSEAFFRGFLEGPFLDSRLILFASIASTLLFALCWPPFNQLAGLILGATASALFYVRRSVRACVIANVSFTLGGVTLLVWRAL